MQRNTKRGMLPPLGDRGRNLLPTLYRRHHFQDHLPPKEGMHDADGRLWAGTSKIRDRAARRKANKRSWEKLVRERRRQTVAMKRMPADVRAALEAQGVK